MHNDGTVSLTYVVEEVSDTGTDEPPSPTFRDAVMLYRIKGRNAERCRAALQCFADTPLDAITTEAIQQEARRRYPHAKSSTVVRQFIGPISAVMRLAAETGLCKELLIPRPSLAQPRSIHIFCPKDAQRLAAACCPRFRPLLLTLYLTGATAQECVLLRWDQIDLVRRKIRFPKTRTLAGRCQLMHPHLYEVLCNIPRNAGHVFSRPDGKPYVARGNAGASIRHVFHRACKKAGITSLKVRDLRTSWAAVDFARHGDIDKVQRRGGWNGLSQISWLKKLCQNELDELRAQDAAWDTAGLTEGAFSNCIDAETTPVLKAIPATQERPASLPSRLLRPTDAARYCGLPLSRFLSICPVPPIELGESVRSRRYDRVALDEWIDKLTKPRDSAPSDWLGLVEPRHARHPREGVEEGAREGAHLLVSSRDDDEAEG